MEGVKYRENCRQEFRRGKAKKNRKENDIKES